MATLLKDYGIVVTAVIGLGMAILGYFFGKWDSERRRKYEIEDRDYKRRAATWDTRIQEARDLVDTCDKAFHDANMMLFEAELFLREKHQKTELSKSKNEIKRELVELGEFENEVNRKTSEIRQLLKDVFKNSSILEVLDDDELSDLFLKLQYFNFKNETGFNTFLKQNLANQEINFDDEVKRILRNTSQASMIVAQMKTRLDELAQKVP